MSEGNRPLEAEDISGHEDELPIRVMNEEGEWVDLEQEAEIEVTPTPEVPESGEDQPDPGPEVAEEPTQIDERTRVILEVLDGNAESVIEAVREAENPEILTHTHGLEKANKNRKSVLDAIETKLHELKEVAEPETQIDEEARKRTEELVSFLETENSKAVIASVRNAQADDMDVLIELSELEIAGKNRKTVVVAISKKLEDLKEAAKPKEPKPEKPKPRKRIRVSGHVKEVLGSHWKDDEGNIFVLDSKMGEPTGVFALRLVRRAGS